MLLGLAYLAVTNAFALLRLLPVSDRDKDVEILALRHQITVLGRQLGNDRPRFDPSDRAFSGGAAAPAPAQRPASVAAAGAPGHRPAVAPGPARTPPRGPVPAQAPRPAADLVTDLEDVGCRAKYLIRDRDSKFPAFGRHRPPGCGCRGRAQRDPDATHERDHGAVGTDLPP
ncbi:hypothetical protein [Dactylosporangium salmoneum]|uniref:Uncharacterized protein n=1 Tax=Dactylosporangium salmoneum TaxID=53361 RepID=A0ABP5TV24_9ACTN